MDILRKIDDTLHAISTDKKKPSDNSKDHKRLEQKAHISKDPACPACARKSGLRCEEVEDLTTSSVCAVAG
eukprot:754604-Amphidinium_carterae.1